MKIKSRSIILFILFVGFIVNTISNVKAEDIKPEIYGVRINIYNHLLGSGYGTCSVESPCGFELRIWVSGNFTSLDQGDVDFKTAVPVLYFPWFEEIKLNDVFRTPSLQLLMELIDKV